jgi:hypothetical protein
MVVDGRKYDKTRDLLLAHVEDFLEETGMSKTRFGLITVATPGLVDNLRAGKDVTTATYDKCMLAIDVFRAKRLKVKQRKPYTYRGSDGGAEN